VAHCTVIEPTDGSGSTYSLFHVAVGSDDFVNPRDLMTANVFKTQEPIISYPILRATGGTFELLCFFIKQSSDPFTGWAVRGLVGISPTWTEEQITSTDANSPGASGVQTIGGGIGPDGNPYAVWFVPDEADDFYYLYFSKGGNAGAGWAPPTQLFQTPGDDSTDFLSNGATVAPLDGIGLAITGGSTFITAGASTPAVDGAVYFELDLQTPVVCACQLGFHGARRIAGKSPLAPTYDYCPKSFTYKIPFVIDRANADGSGNPAIPIVVAKQMTDYDFELHDIKIVYQNNDTLPAVKGKVWILDMNRNSIMSKPALDVFINELSYYGNGALVPPLFYQKNSQFRMDFYSLLGSADIPVNAELQLIGIQRYPK